MYIDEFKNKNKSAKFEIKKKNSLRKTNKPSFIYNCLKDPRKKNLGVEIKRVHNIKQK